MSQYLGETVVQQWAERSKMQPGKAKQGPELRDAMDKNNGNNVYADVETNDRAEQNARERVIR